MRLVPNPLIFVASAAADTDKETMQINQKLTGRMDTQIKEVIMK